MQASLRSLELTTSGLLCFTPYQRLHYTINGFSLNTSVLAAAHTLLKLRFFIGRSETSAKVKHAGLVREAWRFRNIFGLTMRKVQSNILAGGGICLLFQTSEVTFGMHPIPASSITLNTDSLD